MAMRQSAFQKGHLCSAKSSKMSLVGTFGADCGSRNLHPDCLCSLLPATDLLGQSGHDDPATANSGTGPVLSMGTDAPADTGTSGFAATGTANLTGWSGAADDPLTHPLPFSFMDFNQTFATVRLPLAGYIFGRVSQNHPCHAASVQTLSDALAALV